MKVTKTSSKKRKKLGEILLEESLIDDKTLSQVLKAQKKSKKLIGDILVEMGIVDYGAIAEALSRQLNIPLVHLNVKAIEEEILTLFPPELIKKHLALPFAQKGNRLMVAMADPLNQQVVDDFQFIAQKYISVAVAPKNEIISAIEQYISDEDFLADLGNEAAAKDNVEILNQENRDDTASRDLMDLAELPPVVRFTNVMIANAIKLNASDIHIEPKKNVLSIRCRVDGIMEEIMKTDRRAHAPIVSRIKIISDLDIANRRTPQDGKAQVRFAGKQYDLRVSTIPTSEGEKVTIRILDPDLYKISLEDLGFADDDLKKFTDAITVSQGIVLVTGPTGSGKSSTLYACLNRLNTPEVNIITVEDPVEYDIQGINQVQINPKTGMTFASGLRSILRQDPDIVLVGEIRDPETAAVAFQAAQTGHLVFSTLHTNDAPSAVTRLIDLEIDEFLIFDSLVAVLGQRLVRRICPHCKVPDTPDPRLLERIRSLMPSHEKPSFWKGAGCEQCNHKGFSGRMALFEMLLITPAIKKQLKNDISALKIKEIALDEGFRTLTMDGVRKALQGLTTIEEVFRVAAPEINKAEDRDSSPAPREGNTEQTVKPPQQDSPADHPSSCTEEKLPFTSEVKSPVVNTGPKILVVEDNLLTRELISNILMSNNFQVFSAENGIKALEIVSVEHPDLIITDYHMPQMDGVELVKEVKSNPSTGRTPIIMLTAEDQVDAEVEVLGAGADDYLIKPIDPNRFLARVGKLINS